MMNTDLPRPASELRPCFQPRRLGHANFFVRDYERAFEFYNRVSGFEEVYRQPDLPGSFLSNGNTYHDFALTDLSCRFAPPGQQAGLFHLAFEVETEADLVEGYRASLAQGMPFDFCQDHDVAHSCYRTDPDGNMVEVYADVIEDWRSARNGIVSGKKPVWVPGESNVPLTEPRYPKNPSLRTVEDSVFRGRRVTHVGLATHKLEEMVAFYTAYLGLRIVARSAGGAWALLGGTVADCTISLFRAHDQLPAGFHHMGIEVASEADLDRALTMLPKAGLSVERDMDHPARRAITIQDPDAIRLQFYVNRDWQATHLAGLSAQDAPYVL
jgi:catechol 2,3-dioxygenase